MTSQPGQQIITKHILSNISRRKCSQTIKFGQLNVTREIVLWRNNTQNVLKKLVPNPFIKNH